MLRTLFARTRRGRANTSTSVGTTITTESLQSMGMLVGAMLRTKRMPAQATATNMAIMRMAAISTASMLITSMSMALTGALTTTRTVGRAAISTDMVTTMLMIITSTITATIRTITMRMRTIMATITTSTAQADVAGAAVQGP